jgi:2-iminobutanoate/2-iminopropanoate deaminase
MKRVAIIPPGTDTAKMVVAPGMRAGDLLFLSGSTGFKDGKLVGPDVESQARQAFENQRRVLEAAGSSLDNVVKVNCHLTHPDRDLQGWNKVFKEYFPTNPPARATVGGALVREGAVVEIEIVATV